MIYSSSFFRQSGIEGLYNLSISNPVNLRTCKYAIDRPEILLVYACSLIDIAEQRISIARYVVSLSFCNSSSYALYSLLFGVARAGCPEAELLGLSYVRIDLIRSNDRVGPFFIILVRIPNILLRIPLRIRIDY